MAHQGKKFVGEGLFQAFVLGMFFFKCLPEVENISKRALKSSWYRDIRDGKIRPPSPSASPSKYFKLLFDITDEELEFEHRKFDTASLESFKRRFGEKAEEEYEKYRKR